MNRQIFQGAAASVVYTATTVLAGVVQLRLVIEALAPAIAGLWLLFLTVGSYAAWLDLGMSPTVAREISFAAGALDRSEQDRTFRIAELLKTLWHVFRVVAVCAGLFSMAVGEIAIRNSANYGWNPAIRWAWAMFSVGVSLNLLGGMVLAGLFGIGSVATEKLIRSVAALVGLALAIVTLKLGWGILGLSLAWVLQSAVSGSLGWYYLHRRLPRLSSARCAPNWPLARKLASPSLKLAAIQLGAILILQSANPLIAATIGAAAIPPYEAVSRIAATMMTLALLIVNSSAPYLSMAYAAGEFGKFTRLLVRNLRLGLGLMVVLCTFVAVNGDRIVSVWLGRPMFAGFAVLWVLLFMVLLEVHHVIFATAVMAAGQIVFGWAALASGILNIVFAVFLAGRFGLLGIALAIAIGQLLTNNWYAPYFAIRFFKIPAAMLVRQVWVPTVALLLAELMANILLKQLAGVSRPSFSGVAASFIVSACVGAGIWCLLLLESSERTEIRKWFQGWSVIKAVRT